MVKDLVVIGESEFEVYNRSVGEVSSDDHAATSSCLGRVINSVDDVQRAIKSKMKSQVLMSMSKPRCYLGFIVQTQLYQGEERIQW